MDPWVTPFMRLSRRTACLNVIQQADEFPASIAAAHSSSTLMPHSQVHYAATAL
jgi:hypothetical protein